ncbi:MAG: FtsQ-type POTRA domain-containing protein [Acidobacteriota bacterium]|nr:MAG: FtsQ-type POTRA domain-containing protein [Acidobacteriota bacterium]
MKSMLRSLGRAKRRPRRQKRSRWWALAAAALLVTVAGSAAYGLHRLAVSPALRVRQILIGGAQRLEPARIRSIVSRTLGEPILLVRLSPLRAEVEALPAVETALVARRMPDTLEVRIRERTGFARLALAQQIWLVDRAGALFPSGTGQARDGELPWLQGLETREGDTRLASGDLAALAALEALIRVTGQAPPPGTVVDLSPSDRIVLRPGEQAPSLWLDRAQPQRNLEQLFAWRDRIAELAPGRAVDLRFHNRLTVAPERDDPVRR